jgi:hypothetical protein
MGKTNEEIEMIANFMGMERRAENENCWINSNTKEIIILGAYTPYEDWNELMDVVEKIENIKDESGMYLWSLKIGRDYCIFESNDFRPKTICARSYNNEKLRSVYECVVEAIKYLNQLSGK